MVKLSAMPKCWIEDICEGRMQLLEWFDLAIGLECDGLELYSGFLSSNDSTYLSGIRREAFVRGMEIPMFCYSPDFTVIDKELLASEIEGQKNAIRTIAELGGRYCRVLSGQRREGLAISDGVAQATQCIESCLAEAERCGIVLVIENHYKDGYWKFPEFAQKQAVFMQIVNGIDSPYFGVQYDPSNAIVAGEDPLELLRLVAARVRTMHASDRYVEEGHDIEEVIAYFGKQGYHPALKHGEVGKGLNDYDAIFETLASVGFDGWISIEDGMNGLDEMRRSLDFLKKYREHYFIKI
jgi:sugar phosphate isomerase/epimerase